MHPHPALRATFSQREKDTNYPFRLIWTPRLSLWERLPEGERHANSRSTRESVAEQETRDQEVLPARTENWLHISKADAPSARPVPL